MSNTTAGAEQVAEVLWSAWRTGRRLDALPAGIRPTTVQEGWHAQQFLTAAIGPRVGWKIAATSAAGQAHIGVQQPLPGPLCERFLYASGDSLPSDTLHMRVVEAEFAFRMGEDVPAGAEPAAVLAAIDTLHLAIEVPDSRFSAFDVVGGPSLLADCACAGFFVLGPEVRGWRDDDLSQQRTEIAINGQRAATGGGDAVLGDPRQALVWFADELAALGTHLRAGEVVTTGTTTVPPTIGSGDDVVADFGQYGLVRVSFDR
jgi:2-keto-4-pentenoate hydratase